MTVPVIGVAYDWPSMRSGSPGGDVVTVTCTVGSMRKTEPPEPRVRYSSAPSSVTSRSTGFAAPVAKPVTAPETGS